MDSKIILVTGGNRGIGLGIVTSIADRSPNATIIIATRSKENAELAIKELQDDGKEGSFYPLTLDVTDDSSIHAAVAEVKSHFGRLDVLINNAGIAYFEDPLSPTTTREAWNRVLNTNITSLRLLTLAFLPLLHLSRSPRVINISSARGSFSRLLSRRDPPAPSLPYSCSKACVNFLTLSMALELEDQGVRAYAVSPGHCGTALNGFRGKRDPIEGGAVAAELAVAAEGGYASGFWEDEGKGMREVEW